MLPASQPLPQHPPADALKVRLSALLDDLIRHDGFGSLSVEVRLLKRGQKEVIIDCGKQYRYVIDFVPG